MGNMGINIFVIVLSIRGKDDWNLSGFLPTLDRAEAEKKIQLHKSPHGDDYEYKVIEFMPKEG